MQVFDILTESKVVKSMDDLRNAFDDTQWMNIIKHFGQAKINAYKGDTARITRYITRAQRRIGAQNPHMTPSSYKIEAHDFGIKTLGSARTALDIYEKLAPFAEKETKLATPVQSSGELNFGKLAKQIHDGLKGFSENLGEIKSVLASLRSADDWQKLKSEFTRYYNEDLEQRLIDEIDDTNLRDIKRILSQIGADLAWEPKSEKDRTRTDNLPITSQIPAEGKLDYNKSKKYLTDVFDTIRNEYQGNTPIAADKDDLDNRKITFYEYLLLDINRDRLESLKNRIYGRNKQGGMTRAEIDKEIDAYLAIMMRKYNVFTVK